MKYIWEIWGLFWSILITQNFKAIDGAKILGIFSYPAKSHFIFNDAVLKSLEDKGHEVTVITSFPHDVTLKNFTLIDTSKDFDIQVENTTYNEFTGYSSLSILKEEFNNEKPTCYKFWQLEEIQNIMNSDEKLYDIVFVEIYHIYKCFLPIARKLKVPVIGTMTFKSWIPADLAISNPNHPGYIPYEVSITWNRDNFFDRVWNVWNYCMVHYYRYMVIFPFLEQFYREHLQHVVSYDEYMDTEPSLVFYNTHPTYTPRPMNRNAIEIAGIHIKPVKPLPTNIKEFIDEAEHGVILFTLGSLVKAATLAPSILNAFMDAFASIPQRVIIKYEERLNTPSNVLALRWLPQRDILEHKNVKAFISHCGQGGVYEAIYTATPVIGCPLMFDQPTNIAVLEHAGVAIRLHIESVSKEIVLSALNAIINDTSYRDRMQELSDAFRNRPMTPQESVVYWTEYVLRYNGAPHIQSAATHLNWFQYFLLDVVCFLIFLLIMVIVFIKWFVKLVNFFFKRTYHSLKEH